MLKPRKKIFLSLFLLAVVISSIGLYIASETLTPYRLALAAKPKSVNNYDKIFFHDINNDGISERFVVHNHFNTHDMRHLKIYDQTHGLINQWNFKDSILVKYITCKDINRDGSEDIFIWIQKYDSLFLSILDIKTKDQILDHAFVLNSPGPFPLQFWDIENIKVLLPSNAKAQQRYFYFALTSGYSKRPRGVYIFDMQKQQITRQCNILASLSNLQKIDPEKDSSGELLFTSYATGNYPPQADFSDAQAWLILLNHQLDTLHTKHYPKEYSSYSAYPFQKNGKTFVAAITNLPNHIIFSILDSRFKVVQSKIFTFNLKGLFFNKETQTFTVYGGLYSTIFRLTLDGQLKELNQFKIPSPEGIDYYTTIDFDRDGKPNFYFNPETSFSLLDEDLQVLARATFPNNQNIYDVTYNWRANKKLPQLSINTNHNNYLYNIIPNPAYSHLYLLFILSIVILFLIFSFIHWLINRVRIYLSYFLFSLKESDNAIVLLNHKGAILSFNQKVKQTLQLELELKNRQSFKTAFAQRAEICTVIEEGINTQTAVKKEVSFEDANSTFIGELTVTPFFSFFHFANAFLVEIKDSTHQVLSDRQSNWQRSVRKMVHDIKNPLGGVQLKLQSIYLKLNEVYPEAAEALQDELESAHSEIKRIRNISREFLKFSDLDSPHFEKVPIKPFIKGLLQHFSSFRNDVMTIKVVFGKDLPEELLLDIRQTEMLLHILIENAIDALKGRGKIEIHLDLVQCLQDPQKQSLEIKVTDNGPGIPVEYQDKIFEPHFSLKTEGTGMGLVFAKHIVQQHGGLIEFKSSIGTSFIVLLPLIENAD